MGLLSTQEAYLKTFPGFQPNPQATSKENAKTLMRRYGFEIGKPQYCDVVNRLKDLRKAHGSRLERVKAKKAEKKKQSGQPAATNQVIQEPKKTINAPQLTGQKLDAALYAWFQSFEGFPVDPSRGWEHNFESLRQWQKAQTTAAGGKNTHARPVNASSAASDAGKEWRLGLPTASELDYLRSTGFHPHPSIDRKGNILRLAQQLQWTLGCSKHLALVVKMHELGECADTVALGSVIAEETRSTRPVNVPPKQDMSYSLKTKKDWRKQLLSSQQFAYLQSFDGFKASPIANVETNLRDLVKHMRWQTGSKRYQKIAEKTKEIGMQAGDTDMADSARNTRVSASPNMPKSSTMQAELEAEVLGLSENQAWWSRGEILYERFVEDGPLTATGPMDISEADHGGVRPSSAEDEDVMMRQV